jgi:hypothetical protein
LTNPLVGSGRKDILGFSQAADYTGKNMIDSFFSAGRWMKGFEFITLLILFVSALLICPGCGGGGGGGSSESLGSSGSPGSPGSPGAGDTSGSINLAWEASSDSAAVGHWVYYGTGSFNDNKENAGPRPGPGITIFYTLEGLAKGQTYHIAVTAYDINGNESNPEECSVDGVAK